MNFQFQKIESNEKENFTKQNKMKWSLGFKEYKHDEMLGSKKYEQDERGLLCHVELLHEQDATT